MVFWTEDRQYGVVATSKIHGDVAEGRETIVDWQEGTKGTKAMAGRVFLIRTGTKVGRDQLGSLTSNRCKKNDIRPPEITLVLIFKITMVISCRTSNSFGLQNRFSLNQM